MSQVHLRTNSGLGWTNDWSTNCGFRCARRKSSSGIACIRRTRLARSCAHLAKSSRCVRSRRTDLPGGRAFLRALARLRPARRASLAGSVPAGDRHAQRSPDSRTADLGGASVRPARHPAARPVRRSVRRSAWLAPRSAHGGCSWRSRNCSRRLSKMADQCGIGLRWSTQLGPDDVNAVSGSSRHKASPRTRGCSKRTCLDPACPRHFAGGRSTAPASPTRALGCPQP